MTCGLAERAGRAVGTPSTTLSRFPLPPRPLPSPYLDLGLGGEGLLKEVCGREREEDWKSSTPLPHPPSFFRSSSLCSSRLILEWISGV